MCLCVYIFFLMIALFKVYIYMLLLFLLIISLILVFFSTKYNIKVERTYLKEYSQLRLTTGKGFAVSCFFKNNGLLQSKNVRMYSSSLKKYLIYTGIEKNAQEVYNKSANSKIQRKVPRYYWNFSSKDEMFHSFYKLELEQAYMYAAVSGNSIDFSRWFGFFPRYPAVRMEEMEIVLFFVGYGLDQVGHRDFVRRMLYFVTLFKVEREYLDFLTTFTPEEIYSWVIGDNIPFFEALTNVEEIRNYVLSTPQGTMDRERAVEEYLGKQYERAYDRSTMENLLEKIFSQKRYLWNRRFDDNRIVIELAINFGKAINDIVENVINQFLNNKFVLLRTWSLFDYLELFVGFKIKDNEAVWRFFLCFFRWYRLFLQEFLHVFYKEKLKEYFSLYFVNIVSKIIPTMITWFLCIHKFDIFYERFYILYLFDINKLFEIVTIKDNIMYYDYYNNNPSKDFVDVFESSFLKQNLVLFHRHYQSVISFYIMQTHEMLLNFLKSSTISSELKFQFFILIRFSDFLKLENSILDIEFFFRFLDEYKRKGVLSNLMFYTPTDALVKNNLLNLVKKPYINKAGTIYNIFVYIKSSFSIKLNSFSKLYYYFRWKDFGNYEPVPKDVHLSSEIEDFFELVEESISTLDMTDEMASQPQEFEHFSDDDFWESPNQDDGDDEEDMLEEADTPVLTGRLDRTWGSSVDENDTSDEDFKINMLFNITLEFFSYYDKYMFDSYEDYKKRRILLLQNNLQWEVDRLRTQKPVLYMEKLEDFMDPLLFTDHIEVQETKFDIEEDDVNLADPIYEIPRVNKWVFEHAHNNAAFAQIGLQCVGPYLKIASLLKHKTEKEMREIYMKMTKINSQINILIKGQTFVSYADVVKMSNVEEELNKIIDGEPSLYDGTFSDFKVKIDDKEMLFSEYAKSMNIPKGSYQYAILFKACNDSDRVRQKMSKDFEELGDFFGKMLLDLGEKEGGNTLEREQLLKIIEPLVIEYKKYLKQVVNFKFRSVDEFCYDVIKEAYLKEIYFFGSFRNFFYNFFEGMRHMLSGLYLIMDYILLYLEANEYTAVNPYVPANAPGGVYIFDAFWFEYHLALELFYIQFEGVDFEEQYFEGYYYIDDTDEDIEIELFGVNELMHADPLVYKAETDVFITLMREASIVDAVGIYLGADDITEEDIDNFLSDYNLLLNDLLSNGIHRDISKYEEGVAFERLEDTGRQYFMYDHDNDEETHSTDDEDDIGRGTDDMSYGSSISFLTEYGDIHEFARIRGQRLASYFISISNVDLAEYNPIYRRRKYKQFKFIRDFQRMELIEELTRLGKDEDDIDMIPVDYPERYFFRLYLTENLVNTRFLENLDDTYDFESQDYLMEDVLGNDRKTIDFLFFSSAAYDDLQYTFRNSKKISMYDEFSKKDYISNVSILKGSMESDINFFYKLNYPAKFLGESKDVYYKRLANKPMGNVAMVDHVLTTLEERFSDKNFSYKEKFSSMLFSFTNQFEEDKKYFMTKNITNTKRKLILQFDRFFFGTSEFMQEYLKKRIDGYIYYLDMFCLSDQYLLYSRRKEPFFLSLVRRYLRKYLDYIERKLSSDNKILFFKGFTSIFFEFIAFLFYEMFYKLSPSVEDYLDMLYKEQISSRARKLYRSDIRLFHQRVLYFFRYLMPFLDKEEQFLYYLQQIFPKRFDIKKYERYNVFLTLMTDIKKLNNEMDTNLLVFRSITKYFDIILEKTYPLLKSTTLRSYVSTMRIFYKDKGIWYSEMSEKSFLDWIMNKSVTLPQEELTKTLTELKNYRKFLNKNMNKERLLEYVDTMQLIEALQKDLLSDNDFFTTIEVHNTFDEIDKDDVFDSYFYNNESNTIHEDVVGATNEDMLENSYNSDLSNISGLYPDDMEMRDIDHDLDLYDETVHSVWNDSTWGRSWFDFVAGVDLFPEKRNAYFPFLYRIYHAFLTFTNTQATQANAWYKYLIFKNKDINDMDKYYIVKKHFEESIFDEYDSIIVDESYDEDNENFADNFSPRLDTDFINSASFTTDPEIMGQRGYDFFFEKLDGLPRNVSWQLLEFRNEISLKLMEVTRRRLRILIRLYFFYRGVASRDSYDFFKELEERKWLERTFLLFRKVLSNFIGLGLSPRALRFIIISIRAKVKKQRIENSNLLKEFKGYYSIDEKREFLMTKFPGRSQEELELFVRICELMEQNTIFRVYSFGELLIKIDRIYYFYNLFKKELSLFSCILLDEEVEWFRSCYSNITEAALWYKILLYKRSLHGEERVFMFKSYEILQIFGGNESDIQVVYYIENLLKEHEMHINLSRVVQLYFDYKLFFKQLILFLFFLFFCLIISSETMDMFEMFNTPDNSVMEYRASKNLESQEQKHPPVIMNLPNSSNYLRSVLGINTYY